MTEEPDIWRTPPGQKAEGDLVDQLTDYGRVRMLRELIKATDDRPGMVVDSAHPIAYVVESYRRSALIRQNPSFPPTAEDLASARPYTMEELREELGLDG